MELRISVTGANEASAKLAKLVNPVLPETLRQIKWAIGERIEKNTSAVFAAHFRRRSGTMLRHMKSQRSRWVGEDVVWSLPAGELQTRIAAFHNKGGQITAKKGQFLRIPFPGGPALTAAGVDRFPQPLRSVGGFFVHNDKLWRRDPKGKGIQPWYLLRRSVVLPKRPWLYDLAHRVALEVPRIARAFAKKAIEEAK